jgi:hypothetical protein
MTFLHRDWLMATQLDAMNERKKKTTHAVQLPAFARRAH